MENKQKKIATIQIWILMIGFAILFLLFLIGLWGQPESNQGQVFFHRGEDYMADFINVLRYSAERNPYVNEMNGLWEKAYFPLTYLLFFVFGRILGVKTSDNDFSSFMLAGTVLIVAFMMMLLAIQIYDMTQKEKLYKFLMAVILMASGVGIFSYERGNVVLLAVSGIIFFLVTYESENKVLRELGYIALALAAALKGWPAFLGLLLIYNKQWKEAIRLVIYGIVASVGPFLLLKGGLGNIPLWWRNFQLNTEAYQFAQQPKLGYHYFIAYDATLFYEDQIELRDIWKPAMNILAVFGMVTNVFQKKKWICVAMLVCIMLILPSNSGYYCLMYLFPVIILYLNEKDKSWIDLLYLPIFLMCLCPYQIIQKGTGLNLTLFWSNIALFVLFGGLMIQNIICVMQFVKEKTKGISNNGD